MYTPSMFAQTDRAVVRALVADRPLGTLVALTSEGLDAHHIPFLLHEDEHGHGVLHGHIARANTLWKQIDDRFPTIAIFRGADHFVSPGWYPGKLEDPRVVPTWNFAVVHFHGHLKFIHDGQWLRQHLDELTDRHEARRERPWRIDDAPADYVESMLEAVVGLEFTVSRIEAKWKVSQNQAERNRDGVLHGLLREGTSAAAEMAGLVWNSDPRRCPRDAG